MTWLYVQRTGHLYAPDGKRAATGYSGHGKGLNNPAMQNVHATGPLPIGTYTIGSPQSPVGHLGPLALFLTPDKKNDMHGRSAFFVHGDNLKVNYSASDGCIILSRSFRQMLVDSPDRQLHVVAEKPKATET